MPRCLPAGVLAAALSFVLAPAAHAYIKCPPGTFPRETGLYYPTTGQPIYYCAIDRP